MSSTSSARRQPESLDPPAPRAGPVPQTGAALLALVPPAPANGAGGDDLAATFSRMELEFFRAGDELSGAPASGDA